jgi:hypothetical protein
METGDEARARKLALNQDTFRTANERIERAVQSYHFEPNQGVPFICECADQDCHQTVMLSLADYEAVRAHADRFFVALGHDKDTHERTLETKQGYALVTKIGEAGMEAARLDPRTNGPS